MAAGSALTVALGKRMTDDPTTDELLAAIAEVQRTLIEPRPPMFLVLTEAQAVHLPGYRPATSEERADDPGVHGFREGVPVYAPLFV